MKILIHPRPGSQVFSKLRQRTAETDFSGKTESVTGSPPLSQFVSPTSVNIKVGYLNEIMGV